MLYRIRRYRAVPENADAFHEFFNRYLLPVQRRHGARLVGRWATEDGEIVAVWEYDDQTAYERIQGAVAGDPDSAHAQEVRKGVGALFSEVHESFARNTARGRRGTVATSRPLSGRSAHRRSDELW